MKTLVFALLALSGLFIGFMSTEAMIAYAIGLTLGIIISFLSIRKLGSKAKQSAIASAVFRKITSYSASVYNIPRQPNQTIQAVVYENGHDYASIVDILKKQMKFPTEVAKSAAQHAMDTALALPLQDKVKVALQYIDENQTNNA